MTDNSAAPASQSDFPAALTSALDRLDPHNKIEAALLLACPHDAAPGIDLYYNDQVVGFRGVRVERASDVVTTATRLREAILDSTEVVAGFRQLSAAPHTWVGWYQSGTRMYSAGLWAMFGYPDLSVPANAQVSLSALTERLLDTALPPVFGSNSTLTLVVDGTEVEVSLPADPSIHFAQVSAPEYEDSATEPGPLPGHWDVTEEATAWVAEALDVSKIITVPFGGTEDMILMDLVATLPDGTHVVIPVSASTSRRSLQIGVQPSRIERLSPEDAPPPPAAGFVVVGRDKTEPGIVARHVESGLFCLFPA